MISLFTKHRVARLNMLTLPTYAVSQAESDELAAKREAQLRWMREKGMTYLGDPLARAELRALRESGATVPGAGSCRMPAAPEDAVRAA